jgi:carboxypeptidase C (cathepsin A)
VRKILQSALLATLIVAACPPTHASDDAKTPAAQDGPNADGFHLPPFPADAHASQSVQVDGRTLKYTVTVGTLPVRDDKGNIFRAQRRAGCVFGVSQFRRHWSQARELRRGRRQPLRSGRVA